MELQEFNIWRPEEKEGRKTIKRTIKKVQLTKSIENTSIFDEKIYTWLINNAPLLEPAKEFLFQERRLKEDVVQKLRIGSVIDSKILIDLVGVQSRYLGSNEKAPRFQFMSSQKTRLYNLQIINSLKRGDKLYVSEGITDCLALLSDGLNAVAIPSATILPLEDLVMLKNYDLHMYPDQDEAGQKAFIALRRFFVNHYSMVKAEVLPEGVKDYCDFYLKKQETFGKE